MAVLLDTCVVIDFLRGFPAAVRFFDAMDAPPVISTITVAELYAGAKTKSQKQVVEDIIETFSVVDVTRDIAEKGGEWACQYTPSHGTDLPDALIAATAEEMGLVLATCNIKHFPMFPKMHRPY